MIDGSPPRAGIFQLLRCLGRLGRRYQHLVIVAFKSDPSEDKGALTG
jgi:hypothetical protein